MREPAPDAAVPSGWRRAFAAAAVVLLAAAGCSRGGDGEPATSPTADPTLTTSPLPADLVGDEPHYPAEVQEYAELTVAAWAAPDLYRLGELATASAHRALVELPGPPNLSWTFMRCEELDESTAAESVCWFHNLDGDELQVMVDQTRLGEAQATTDIGFDPTSYPDDPVTYVTAFVTAWQDGNLGRMRALGAPAAVGAMQHTPAAPAGDYTLGEASGSFITVLVTLAEAGPASLATTVNTSLLGEAQAIRAAEFDPA